MSLRRISDEAFLTRSVDVWPRQAAKQDPTAMSRGLTIILKKNGRVGTRRLGMPDWSGLVADVDARAQAGLDVTNI